MLGVVDEEYSNVSSKRPSKLSKTIDININRAYING
jgi:hypothetical protein